MDMANENYSLEENSIQDNTIIFNIAEEKSPVINLIGKYVHRGATYSEGSGGSGSTGSSDIEIITTNDITEPKNDNVYSALRSEEEFLQKSTSNKQYVKGEVQFSDHFNINVNGEYPFATTNFNNAGGQIIGAQLTRNGILSVAGLKAMSFEVFELIYNVIRAQGGKYVFSNAANVDNVWYLLKDGRKYNVSKNKYEEGHSEDVVYPEDLVIENVASVEISIRKDEATIAMPFKNGDILYGYVNQIGESGGYAKGGQCVMHVVTANSVLGEGGNMVFEAELYPVLGDTESSEENFEKVPSNILPMPGMALAQRGNADPANNEDRLTSFFIDSQEGNIYMLNNVSSPILDVGSYGLVIGKLPFDLWNKIKDEFAYVKETDPIIYAKYGIFENFLQFDHLGNPIPQERSRGEWDINNATDPTKEGEEFINRYKSTKAYYDTVTYDGELYKCTKSDNTNVPSSEDGWMKLVSKGAPGLGGPFKSIVFARATSIAALEPYPEGGSYNEPWPTTIDKTGTEEVVIKDSRWSDGIPEGDGAIYSSWRMFYGDDRESSWSKPSLMSDTADFEVIYSPIDFKSEIEAKAAIPTGFSKNGVDIVNSWLTEANIKGWYDDAMYPDKTTFDALWMATNNRKPGASWQDTGWVVTKIKGEKGEPGQGINPNLLQNSNFDVYDENGKLLNFGYGSGNTALLGSVVKGGYDGVYNSYKTGFVGSSIASIALPISIKKDVTYTFSCKARCSYDKSNTSNLHAIFGFVFSVTDSSKVFIFNNKGVGIQTLSDRYDIYFGETDDWTEKSFSFKYTPADGDPDTHTGVKIYFYRWRTDVDGEYAQLKVEEGELVTPYIKHQDDLKGKDGKDGKQGPPGKDGKDAVFRANLLPNANFSKYTTYSNYKTFDSWTVINSAYFNSDIYKSNSFSTNGFKFKGAQSGSVYSYQSLVKINTIKLKKVVYTLSFYAVVGEIYKIAIRGNGLLYTSVQGSPTGFTIDANGGPIEFSPTSAVDIDTDKKWKYYEITFIPNPVVDDPYFEIYTTQSFTLSNNSSDYNYYEKSFFVIMEPKLEEGVGRSVFVTAEMTGPAGESGPSIFPQGTWNEKTRYVKTDSIVPYVYYNPNNTGEGTYYILNLNSAQGASQSPTSGGDYWKPMTQFDAIYTKFIMANHARFGSADGGIFYDNWLYSAKDNTGQGIIGKPIVGNDGKLEGGTYPKLALDFKEGVLHAENAHIRGHIEATSGTFTGELKAATGNFEGSIIAKSGSIGGFSIGTNAIGTTLTDKNDLEITKNNIKLTGPSRKITLGVTADETLPDASNALINVENINSKTSTNNKEYGIRAKVNASTVANYALYANGSVVVKNGFIQAVNPTTITLDKSITAFVRNGKHLECPLSDPFTLLLNGQYTEGNAHIVLPNVAWVHKMLDMGYNEPFVVTMKFIRSMKSNSSSNIRILGRTDYDSQYDNYKFPKIFVEDNTKENQYIDLQRKNRVLEVTLIYDPTTTVNATYSTLEPDDYVAFYTENKK